LWPVCEETSLGECGPDHDVLGFMIVFCVVAWTYISILFVHQNGKPDWEMLKSCWRRERKDNDKETDAVPAESL